MTQIILTVMRKYIVFTLFALNAAVCYPQEIKNAATADTVLTTVERQLNADDIARAKELARRGIGYYTGKGGYERNFEKALDLLTQASELDNSDAICALAHMYENGNGVEQDYGKAAQLYMKAADKNVVTAQTSLAYFYDEGLGVDQSFVEAVKWYRKAADNNDASAQYNLADMLFNGIGVEKDLEQALAYSRKSLAGGVREASAQISNIQRQISLERAQQAGESGATDADAVYANVPEMPQFPGGNEALLNYLRTNIKYPSVCRENHIQGRVIVTFIINKDGSVETPRVVRGVHGDLDNEALRVISLMPTWLPGRLNGEPVRVIYSIPVNFRLN